MSADGKKKRGVSGASNAKAIPYRYSGGSHDHPVLRDGMARMARQVAGSNPKEFSIYATGMAGGVLWARLGFTFPGWEDAADALGI